MKESQCLTCGSVFESKSEKQLHKKEYPDESCRDKFPKEQDEEVEEEKQILKQIPKLPLLPKDQAKEEWRKYCRVLKTRKEKFLKIMKDAHYQMKEGRELIDIYKVMKAV